MERIKEELALLRLILALAFAAGVALVGWFAQSFESAAPALLAIALAVIVLIVGLFLVALLAILRRLERLEDVS